VELARVDVGVERLDAAAKFGGGFRCSLKPVRRGIARLVLAAGFPLQGDWPDLVVERVQRASQLLTAQEHLAVIPGRRGQAVRNNCRSGRACKVDASGEAGADVLGRPSNAWRAHSAPDCASLGRNRASASEPVASSSATMMSNVLLFGPVMRRLQRRIDQAPDALIDSRASGAIILQQSPPPCKEILHRAANVPVWWLLLPPGFSLGTSSDFEVGHFSLLPNLSTVVDFAVSPYCER